MEAVAACSTNSNTEEGSSSPPAAAAVAAGQSDAAAANTTSENRLPQGVSPDEAAAQGTVSAAASLTPGSDAGAKGSVVITVVDEEDEYGDDFDFLTDADLQALEEQATKTAAICSQQAAPQQHDSRSGHNFESGIGSSQPAPPTMNWTGARSSQNGISNTSRTAGTGAQVGGSATSKCAASTPNTAGSGSCGAPQAAVSKRAFNGSAGRPPLSTIGPNPKRGGSHDHQQKGRATSGTSYQGSRSSSQGGNHAPSQLPQHPRGRATPGRGEGAANNAAFRSPPNKRNLGDGTATAGVADEARLQGKGSSGGEAAPGRAETFQQGATPAANDPDLFTTYSSMEAFTRSTKPGRLNAGHASAAAGAASEKGQARLTKWAQQNQNQNRHQQPAAAGTRSTVPARAAAGQGTTPSHHPHVPTAPREFHPALVHRRFLVLEVTYVSARSSSGTGVREKVLMALEQGQKETTAAVDPAAILAAKDGGGGGEGTGMAQQRKISLLEDWYDCEVEPGDVVHVLFPVGGAINSRGDQASPAKKAASSPEAEEEMLSSPHVVVDNRSGRLLVVQPDILVSPTKVADTVQCTRKAVLQSRLTSDASKSKPAVLGNLKHELFETSLLAAAAAAAVPTATSTPQQRAGQRFPAARAAPVWQKDRPAGAGSGSDRGDLLTFQYMSKLVNRIVVSQLEALYGAGLDEDTARRELLNVSGPILQWHRSFLARAGGNGDGTTVGSGGRGEGGTASFNSAGARDARVAVCRVLATEDDVWSPVLGLKGIMDATVEASVQPFQAPVHGGGDGEGGDPLLVMPVEVKTGKRIGEANSSHRAQVRVVSSSLFGVIVRSWRPSK